MKRLVLLQLVRFKSYYSLIMSRVRGMHLIHERNETTLPWSTACDSGTTPKSHYSAKEKGKHHYSSGDTVENTFATINPSKCTYVTLTLFSPVTIYIHTLLSLKHRPLGDWLMCKSESDHLHPKKWAAAHLWSVSGEPSDLCFCEDFVWSLNTCSCVLRAKLMHTALVDYTHSNCCDGTIICPLTNQTFETFKAHV